VIERDATTLWNFRDDSAKQETEIDLASVDDSLCLDVIKRCYRAGLSLRVWEATSDIGVATYVAELRETTVKRGAVWGKAAFGSGCHASRSVALVRAVTEAAQARTTFIAGARDDMSWGDYESDDGPALAMRKGGADEPDYRPFSAAPSWTSETINGDLLWVMERLSSRGLNQVIAVDLTKAEFALPVVRVIVPGLEGPDEHFSDYVPGLRARALMDAADPAGLS